MTPEIQKSLKNKVDSWYSQYNILPEFGFLPQNPPFRVTDDTGNREKNVYLRNIEAIVENLHDHISYPDIFYSVKDAVRCLPYPNWRITENIPLSHRYRLQFILSMIMHAYFSTTIDYERIDQLAKRKETHIVPAQLAIPLYELSKITGMAPSMAYGLYGPWNYRVLNSKAPFDLENITLINSFTNSRDEKWFVMIHQVVDYKFARAIRPMLEAYYLTTYCDWNDFDPKDISSRLKAISEVQQDMFFTLCRMREECGPETYFNTIRRFYTIPENLKFEGVKELEGRTLSILGETGGQDPFKQFLHAFLGMNFDKEDFGGIQYFARLRQNMFADRRDLIEQVMGLGNDQKVSQVREYVMTQLESGNKEPAIYYDDMIIGLLDWMDEHFSLAKEYVGQAGETYGTVKAPFKLLMQIRDETEDYLIIN